MERKLTAILSADVKGYSRLMGEDEAATILTLNAYREVTDSLIHQHKGRVVGTAGDSILAEFASAVEAVQCAVEIQRELKVGNAELDRQEEARAEVAEILRLNPNASVETYRQNIPYKDPVVLERTLAGLRKAGLK